MSAPDPLRVRLFGYGVLYQVRFGPGGEVWPLDAEAGREARELARELAVLKGLSREEVAVEAGVWALSMPFGRCGVEGLPREYLRLHHSEEGYLEALRPEGCEVRPLIAGEMVRVVPGEVIRVRARPQPGRRVLVAFQTEDRTPLLGNAAAFTLDGQIPAGYAERLVKCHAAFDQVKKMAAVDRPGYRAILDRFFGEMAVRVKEEAKICQLQAEARLQGSYEVADQQPLFDRQQALLTEAVIERIGQQDEQLFRFPGMFGGVTPLFNLIK